MNKNTKVIITVLAVLVAAVAGYAYASPWITLENLRDDAMAGKADNMQDYVDFPAVRDSLKGQIQSVMMKNLQSEEMKDNPFSGLAMMMAGSMIDSLVNTMASPNGFVNIVQGKDVRDKATTQAAATPAQDLASAPAPTCPQKEGIVIHDSCVYARGERMIDPPRRLLSRAGVDLRSRPSPAPPRTAAAGRSRRCSRARRTGFRRTGSGS